MLLASCLSFGIVQEASSEGVVFQSNAKNYERGQVIKNNDRILLDEGEKLVVLDATGKLIPIDQSKTYGEHVDVVQARAGQFDAFAPAKVLVWNEHRADIGGVRSEDFEKCLQDAKESDFLDEEDCRRAHPQKTPAEFDVRVLNLSPLTLHMKVNFDAVSVCKASRGEGELASPSNAGKLVSLAKKTAVTKLRKNVESIYPRRGGGALLERPQLYSEIECVAIKQSDWLKMQKTLNELAEQDMSNLIFTFAGLDETTALKVTTSLNH
jgi:hypothetical protein